MTRDNLLNVTWSPDNFLNPQVAPQAPQYNDYEQSTSAEPVQKVVPAYYWDIDMSLDAELLLNREVKLEVSNHEFSEETNWQYTI